MKVVAISDTHGMHRGIDVPPGDLLIHAGDGTASGQMSEVVDLIEWMESQPHQHKVFVPGNHDLALERRRRSDIIAAAQDMGVHLLIDRAVTFGRVKVYGTPRLPQFGVWAFMTDRGLKIRKKWRKIPDDTDILVTHGPPLGIGDLAPRGAAAGCFELLCRVRKVLPDLHVFGHIHGGSGFYTCDEAPGTTFVNAAICTEAYDPLNPPRVVAVASPISAKRDAPVSTTPLVLPPRDYIHSVLMARSAEIQKQVPPPSKQPKAET